MRRTRLAAGGAAALGFLASPTPSANATPTTGQAITVVHDPKGDAAADRPGPPGLRAYDDVRRLRVVPGSDHWKIALRAQSFTQRLPADNTVTREIWLTYHTSTGTNVYRYFQIITAATSTPPEPYFRQVPGHPKLYENNTIVHQWDNSVGSGCTFWIVPQPHYDRWLVRIPSTCLRKLDYLYVVSGSYSRQAEHSDGSATNYTDNFAQPHATNQ